MHAESVTLCVTHSNNYLMCFLWLNWYVCLFESMIDDGRHNYFLTTDLVMIDWHGDVCLLLCCWVRLAAHCVFHVSILLYILYFYIACRMVICDDQGGNCDIHSHTNRPHTSLEPREASDSCKEPFIHASILEIPAGQVALEATKKVVIPAHIATKGSAPSHKPSCNAHT